MKKVHVSICHKKVIESTCVCHLLNSDSKNCIFSLDRVCEDGRVTDFLSRLFKKNMRLYFACVLKFTEGSAAPVCCKC